MTVDMHKLERHHILKHYWGGPAMALGEDAAAVGEIENIDIEDGSVCLKEGNESHWYDSHLVTASLSNFHSLTREHARCIAGHLIFKGEKIKEEDIVQISDVNGNEWKPGTRTPWKAGVFIYLIDHRSIWITSSWSVIGMTGFGCTPDNIGKIIFLCCQLGYDVGNDFND